AASPSPPPPRAPARLPLTAQDPYGNAATAYPGTIPLASSDPRAQLPADYTFTSADAGRHAFAAALLTAGSQLLAASDTASSSLTGAQTGITVDPAVATTLVLAGFPSPATAGTPGVLTVTALDAYGNTATAYAGTVHLTISKPPCQQPADNTFTSASAGRNA